MRKLDKLTSKFSKGKVANVLKKIKFAIAGLATHYQDYEYDKFIKKLAKHYKREKENIIRIINRDQFLDIQEKSWVDKLMIKKRIFNQFKDSWKEHQFELIKSNIIELIENQVFIDNVTKIKNRKFFVKMFYFIRGIFIPDLTKMAIFSAIENKISNQYKIHKKLYKSVMKLISKFNTENWSENKSIIKDFDYTLSEENIQVNIFNYDTNSHANLIDFLYENMIHNLEVKNYFHHKFIQSSLILGLIGYTDLNFTRTARFTLLMVHVFMNCWISISFFQADGWYYTTQLKNYGINLTKILIVVLSTGISLIVDIIGHFLPNNYLKLEFLNNEKFVSWRSKIAYGFSWSLMMYLAYSACWNGSKLKSGQQIELIQAIFINLIGMLVFLGLIKPAITAAFQTGIIKEKFSKIKKCLCPCRKRNNKILPRDFFESLEVDDNI